MQQEANAMNKAAEPSPGDFIDPPEDGQGQEEPSLPSQEEFWRPPVRFGSVPIEKEPLGWDRRSHFHKAFPRVMLPFQVLERVHFGHGDLEPNRLFWGDNLHVMRQLPSESIDLIYIDPPFFSGRNYNFIFGDQNELRSFSDTWQGGMPGYLIWLNARLFEMKRLLKKQEAFLFTVTIMLAIISKWRWIRFLDTNHLLTRLYGATNLEVQARSDILAESMT